MNYLNHTKTNATSGKGLIMRTNYLIIAVDSKNYNKQFLRKIDTAYSNSICQVIVMGKDPEKVKENIPKTISSLIVSAKEFNYSLATNIVLKVLATRLKEDAAVAITDGNTAVNIIQLFGYEYNTLDMTNSFITSETLFDNSGKTINLKATNPMLIISKRLKVLQGNTKSYIPIIVSTVDTLTNITNGLEENLFTPYSRIQLIKSLENNGFKRKNSEKNFCYYFGKTLEPNPREAEDVKLMKNMVNKRYQNNSDVEWGVIGRVSKISVVNGLPKWESKKLLKEKPEKKIEPALVKSMVIADSDRLAIDEPRKIDRQFCDEFIRKPTGKKVLVLVNNKLDLLISATPLIKMIFQRTGEKVDIMTNDKLGAAIPLIDSKDMIRKIYDISDLVNKLIPFKKYNAIIRSASCNIKIPEVLSTISCPSNSEIIRPTADLNCAILENDRDFMVPTPFCMSQKQHFQKLPDSLVFGSSMLKSSKYRWKYFGILASRLANKGSNITIIGLDKEALDFNPETYMRRNNAIYEEKMNYMKAAAYIKSSKLFIAHPETELAWLGYGLNKNMLIIGKTTIDIPDLDWINAVEVNDETKIEYVIDVIEHILEKI